MSKTKGNVIDPLIVMNELGTDALRFTVLVGSSPGNDMNLWVKKVEANRNFANKIWNAGRYVISAIEKAPIGLLGSSELSIPDRSITAAQNALIQNVNKLFTTHQYGEAGRQIYDFFWSKFADWYIEISKNQMNIGGDSAFLTARTLVNTLDNLLRLLHPFTPFVTEELWGYLKKASIIKGIQSQGENGNWEDALIVAKWPDTKKLTNMEMDYVNQLDLSWDIVKEIRSFKDKNNIPFNKTIPIEIYSGSQINLIKAQNQQ